MKGSTTLHDVGDDDAAETIPGLVVYRFYGPLMFANVRFLIERVEGFIAEEKDPVRQVVLDARAIPTIDITAAEQLGEYVERLGSRGIEFVMAKAHLPLRETLSTVGGGVFGEYSAIQPACGCRGGVQNRTTTPGIAPTIWRGST